MGLDVIETRERSALRGPLDGLPVHVPIPLAKEATPTEAYQKLNKSGPKSLLSHSVIAPFVDFMTIEQYDENGAVFAKDKTSGCVLLPVHNGTVSLAQLLDAKARIQNLEPLNMTQFLICTTVLGILLDENNLHVQLPDVKHAILTKPTTMSFDCFCNAAGSHRAFARGPQECLLTLGEFDKDFLSQKDYQPYYLANGGFDFSNLTKNLEFLRKNNFPVSLDIKEAKIILNKMLDLLCLEKGGIRTLATRAVADIQSANFYDINDRQTQELLKLAIYKLHQIKNKCFSLFNILEVYGELDISFKTAKSIGAQPAAIDLIGQPNLLEELNKKGVVVNAKGCKKTDGLVGYIASALKQEGAKEGATEKTRYILLCVLQAIAGESSAATPSKKPKVYSKTLEKSKVFADLSHKHVRAAIESRWGKDEVRETSYDGLCRTLAGINLLWERYAEQDLASIMEAIKTGRKKEEQNKSKSVVKKDDLNIQEETITKQHVPNTEFAPVLISLATAFISSALAGASGAAAGSYVGNHLQEKNMRKQEERAAQEQTVHAEALRMQHLEQALQNQQSELSTLRAQQAESQQKISAQQYPGAYPEAVLRQNLTQHQQPQRHTVFYGNNQEELLFDDTIRDDRRISCYPFDERDFNNPGYGEQRQDAGQASRIAALERELAALKSQTEEGLYLGRGEDLRPYAYNQQAPSSQMTLAQTDPRTSINTQYDMRQIQQAPLRHSRHDLLGTISDGYSRTVPRLLSMQQRTQYHEALPRDVYEAQVTLAQTDPRTSINTQYDMRQIQQAPMRQSLHDLLGPISDGYSGEAPLLSMQQRTRYHEVSPQGALEGAVYERSVAAPDTTLPAQVYYR